MYDSLQNGNCRMDSLPKAVYAERALRRTDAAEIAIELISVE